MKIIAFTVLLATMTGISFAGGSAPEMDTETGSIITGVDENGHVYKHIINTANYQGVYMTDSRRATGFIDIFGPGRGFCKDNNKLSVSVRTVNNHGKAVVLGTCMEQPVDGVLSQDFGGCGFSIRLLRDAATNQPLVILRIDSGNCSSYGDGNADLSSIAGIGFWLLK